MMTILVAEDDPRTRALLVSGLGEYGFGCEPAANGAAALELLRDRSQHFDLVLLDVMMPVCDGWEVLERMRAAGNRTPVIILTARHEVHERVQGLRLGADDYVIKPFALAELLARIDAVARRTRTGPELGDLRVDIEGRFVELRGLRIELSPREFSLLTVLCREPGRIFTRKELLRLVWGIDFDPGTNLVNVTVGRLRRRIARSSSVFIRTSQGRGYSLELRTPPDGRGKA